MFVAVLFVRNLGKHLALQLRERHVRGLQLLELLPRGLGRHLEAIRDRVLLNVYTQDPRPRPPSGLVFRVHRALAKRNQSSMSSSQSKMSFS